MSQCIPDRRHEPRGKLKERKVSEEVRERLWLKHPVREGHFCGGPTRPMQRLKLLSEVPIKSFKERYIYF